MHYLSEAATDAADPIPSTMQLLSASVFLSAASSARTYYTSHSRRAYCRPRHGALFYSAGFNVNQNFKEQIFLNNSMFQFSS
jgi:hypothetical protein